MSKPKPIAKPKVEQAKPEVKAQRQIPVKYKSWIMIGIIAILFFPIYNYIFDSKIENLGDNATYFILGKSIAEGKGYVHQEIIENVQATHYPPGYPFIISVVVNTFGDSIEAAKKANGFFFLGSLVLLFFFFKKTTENLNLSFVLTLLLLFHFHLLQYSTWSMSEIPFLFVSSLALFSFSLIKTEKQFFKDPWFFASIVVAAGAYYVRGQGLAIIGAFVLSFLFQKKWFHAIFSSIGFYLLILPWQIRNSSLPETAYSQALKLKNYYNPDEGFMEFSDYISRFFTNLERYLKFEIPSSIFGYEADYQGTGSILAGLVIVAIAIYGLVKLNKFKFLLLGYIGATMAILLLWPEVWIGIRFVLAIAPLFMFLIIYGIYSFTSNMLLKSKISSANFITKVLPYFALVLLFGFISKLEVLNKNAKKPYDPLFRNYYAIADWSKNNIKNDSAVFICRKPQLFHIKAGHFVNGFSKKTNPLDNLVELNKMHATHVVFYGDGIASNYFYPLYQLVPEKFPIIQQLTNPDVYLMEYKPDQGYTGEWKDNKKHGKGKYVYPNGNIFEGDWQNDKMHVSGVVKDKDGTILQQGKWSNGVYIQN